MTMAVSLNKTLNKRLQVSIHPQRNWRTSSGFKLTLPAVAAHGLIGTSMVFTLPLELSMFSLEDIGRARWFQKYGH